MADRQQRFEVWPEPQPNPSSWNPFTGECETMIRPEGCVCTSEVGDSACPVHPTCSYCGEPIKRENGVPIYGCGPDCKEPSFHG